MPGIITHFKILTDSIEYLSKRQKKSYLLRSIESLFKTEDHLKAALFGSIGPNIFDYRLKRNEKNHYGNNISFFLHDGGSSDLLSSMIKKLSKFDDFNNEWASVQRAYLYGYLTHIISDSIFHPFMFYWSGFPDENETKHKNYYREQNLLFAYNLDNHFLYTSENTDNLTFDIHRFIPLKKENLFYRINPAVKSFILESLNSVYPEIYDKLIWKKGNNVDTKFHENYGTIDLLPYLIHFTYWIKRKKDKRFVNFLKKINSTNLFRSDFSIQYPPPKKINRHVLNFHKERWQYPASKAGFHYESIDNLLKLTCEKNVEIWEKIESMLYSNKKVNISDIININAYTGTKEAGYHNMKIKNPIKLYF